MGRFKSIADVWSYLDAIPMFGKVGAAAGNFSLTAISDFCSRLGDPQNKFKSIHVAGTNGKGSVCYLLEQIYSEAGYKTGMFTSPHLLKYNERVRIGKQDISDEEILLFFQEAEAILEEIKLTYFEISTALAFWALARNKVDIGIIETGLGGRLDSTNIIDPMLSVITSIGLDHTQILGDTTEAIAGEKAGIIKKGKPVVVGSISMNAMKVISGKAEARESKMIRSGDLEPKWNDHLVQLKGYAEPFQTQLTEPINAWNIAMAISSVNELQSSFPVSEEFMRTAVEHFRGVPARFEKVHPERAWYFSGSHNLQAIDSMLEGLSKLSSERIVCVFSMMKDKVGIELLSRFEVFDELYFYEQEGERAATREDIWSFINTKLISENTYQEILKELKTELVIFTGSFYFYPVIKRWLRIIGQN